MYWFGADGLSSLIIRMAPHLTLAALLGELQIESRMESLLYMVCSIAWPSTTHQILSMVRNKMAELLHCINALFDTYIQAYNLWSTFAYSYPGTKQL